MIYTMPSERLPEWESDRLIDELRNATIWYYPFKDKAVQSFRIPSGSRIIDAGRDAHGRPALHVQVVDPLAECETVFIIRTDSGDNVCGPDSPWSDKRLKCVATTIKHAYFLAFHGHPIVVKSVMR